VRLLLTNDDGVQAPGIAALCRAVQARRGMQVTVSAPERERSAIGHAITLHKPLHANSVGIPGVRSPVWSVSGTPADSTKIAVLALMKERPDLVVSGINRGANVGVDVMYSGTVSAALEATLMGIPAVAVSVAALEHVDYAPAAEFVADMLERLTEAPLPDTPYLLNVNVPAGPRAGWAGVAVTRLGLRYYNDFVVERQDPRGHTYYWLAGEVRDAAKEPAEPGTDIWALDRRMVSITPLRFALTDEEVRRALEPWAGRLAAP
jgi:5'-nucleotidase